MGTVLEVNNLCKRFGKIPVLSDLTLTLSQGQIYGIVGENGSGKSTFFRILAGLLQADSGTLRICGDDMKESRRRAKSHVGFVPDDFGMYDRLVVQESLEFYAQANGLEGLMARKRIGDVLEQVSLLGSERCEVTALSYSMKRRFCIAQALLGEPELLVLDEPVAGLDLSQRRGLYQLFLQLAQEGRTLLLSSHMVNELQTICTDVGLFKQGCIVRELHTPDIMESELRTNVIHIRIAGEGDRAVAALRPLSYVQSISRNQNTLLVTLTGGEAEEQHMLTKLINDGVPVISFERQQEDFESLLMHYNK